MRRFKNKLDKYKGNKKEDISFFIINKIKFKILLKVYQEGIQK